MDSLIMIAGDVFVSRSDPALALTSIAGFLKVADIRFCNLESPLSVRGSPFPAKGSCLRAPPPNIQALTGNFDAVSLSNNHILDYGVDAVEDTLQTLRTHGIAQVGYGQTVGEAWAPIILKHQGCRFGFIAFSMVAPPSYAATSSRSGISLLEVETAYITDAETLSEQPGTPPIVRTSLSPVSKHRLSAACRAARDSCDLLIVSFLGRCIFN